MQVRTLIPLFLVLAQASQQAPKQQQPGFLGRLMSVFSWRWKPTQVEEKPIEIEDDDTLRFDEEDVEQAREYNEYVQEAEKRNTRRKIELRRQRILRKQYMLGLKDTDPNLASLQSDAYYEKLEHELQQDMKELEQIEAEEADLNKRGMKRKEFTRNESAMDDDDDDEDEEEGGPMLKRQRTQAPKEPVEPAEMKKPIDPEVLAGPFGQKRGLGVATSRGEAGGEEEEEEPQQKRRRTEAPAATDSKKRKEVSSTDNAEKGEEHRDKRRKTEAAEKDNTNPNKN